MSHDDISQNDIFTMPHKIEPQGKLPLSETTFYILLTLAPSPKHGYAIMKEVGVLSNERLSLSTGTLYGALKRLLETGWIEAVSQSNHQSSTRSRRAYTLTPLGRAMLDAELMRLQALSRRARVYIAKGRV